MLLCLAHLTKVFHLLECTQPGHILVHRLQTLHAYVAQYVQHTVIGIIHGRQRVLLLPIANTLECHIVMFLKLNFHVARVVYLLVHIDWLIPLAETPEYLVVDVFLVMQNLLLTLM